MRHFAISSIIATSLVGLLAVGQAIAKNPEVQWQTASALQAEEQQQTGANNEQLQIAAEQLTAEQVRTLQQSLREQGVDPGPADGIMNSRTAEAIREFQQEKGMAATGEINRQTLEALHIDLERFMGAAPRIRIEQEIRG